MVHFDEETWAAVVGHPDTALGPPVTAEAVAAFETRHGLTLPAGHREFLLRANGGGVGYVRLFGIGREDALDLGRQVAEMRPWIEAMADGPVLPFASQWGGSYYCYDLGRPGRSGEFPVLLWNHEYAEEPEERPKLWSTFASGFEEFVRRVIA